MPNSYASSLFLPKTRFGIRAEAQTNEPKMLKEWASQNLNNRFKATEPDRFIIHDGPPYANGNLHMGHALNKLLKDIINRMRLANGEKVEYTPGWDCHGLPIEWEVEKQWIKDKKDKSQTSAFRTACRQTAQHWVETQSAQFQRLGIGGNWDTPYLTMSQKAETAIAAALIEFYQKGLIYRKTRPVMWSVVEQTALAEAEVEYKDKTSWAVYVDFRATEGSINGTSVEDAAFVIWTTTPWTIPANCAVAVGKELEYSLVTLQSPNNQASSTPPKAPCKALVVATSLITELKQKLALKVAKTTPLGKGSHFKRVTLSHPLYGNPTPLLAADFVDGKSGTGLVHIAPDHGVEDFYLCQAHKIKPKGVVQTNGVYTPDLKLFGGVHIFKADEEVLAHLSQQNALRFKEQFSHSYPHSWRSGKPLIYLATEQWFMDLAKSGILTKALRAIEEVTWYPATAKRRMKAMLQDRPDWCLSRQRSWGVPLPFFIHHKTGEPLQDKAVFDNTLKIFQKEGSDAWWNRPPADFLGSNHNPQHYTQIKDVADVWLDSGLTHRFAINRIADLYLEGTDQHRGWFQSSLLASLATSNKPPYKAVLTHGFVLDEKGNKMSKSKGNILAPKQIVDQFGADPLRLWVALADYRGDLKLGKHILAENVELYRRIRNTFRFLLGNLANFPKTPSQDSPPQSTKNPSPNTSPASLATIATDIPLTNMPLIEKWILHRLASLEKQFQQAITQVLFHNFYRSLHDFCNSDLSAFYFETLKDSLYCDGANSTERLMAGKVMEQVFTALIRWFSPVLVFTTNEAYLAHTAPSNTAPPQSASKPASKPVSQPALDPSTLPSPNPQWFEPSLDEAITQLQRIRTLIFSAIQKQKQNYPTTLQARAVLTLPKQTKELLACHHLTEKYMAKIALVSEVEFATADQLTATIAPAKGNKCPRCWQYRPEVITPEATLCHRCQQAVEPSATKPTPPQTPPKAPNQK